ncbi:MAG: hypothetical protein EZS28_016357 [Streblomastix strix]|uniref:Uncharacterized protein n=1 Tax=Streblomastix strix TaxID=222440 RepID=A0A5J4W0H1_9EUKA|nr:MAG: hypothetical protein EZS28_016357 [Streblomastix strix]
MPKSQSQKGCARCTDALFGVIIILIAIAAIILGGVYLKTTKLMWSSLIYGIFLFIIGIISLIGTFFDPNGGVSSGLFSISLSLTLFILFFTLILIVVLFFSDGIFFAIAGSPNGYADLLKVADLECDNQTISCMITIIDGVKKYSDVLPWILILSSAVLICSIAITFVIKNSLYFAKITLNFISFLLFVLGAILIALGFIGLFATKLSESNFFETLFIIFVCVGVFLLGAFVVGLLSVCAQAPAVHILYIVILCIAFIIILTTSALTLFLRNSITDSLTDDNDVYTILTEEFDTVKVFNDVDKRSFVRELSFGICQLITALGFVVAFYLLFALTATFVRLSIHYSSKYQPLNENVPQQLQSEENDRTEQSGYQASAEDD